ncbi:MAG: hypothetical protein RLY31_703 [Bacteroidota bacterium]
MQNQAPFFSLGCLILCCSLLTACTGGKAAADTKPKTLPAAAPAEPAEAPYDFLVLEKTPCFGKCPVYKAVIRSDGHATWDGRMNVTRTGRYEGMVSESTIREIRQQAHAIQFLDLEHKYPVDQVVTDLPETILTIQFGDMVKVVRNQYAAPAKLKSFQSFVEESLEKVDWKPVRTNGK